MEDHQQSGSWNHDRDDGEDEQVLQPKVKRKRSMRIRPKYVVERLEDKSGNERGSSQSQLPIQVDQEYDMQSRTDPEFGAFSDPGLERHDLSVSSLSQRCNLPPRMNLHANMQKSSRLSYLSPEDAMVQSRESWKGSAISAGGTSATGTKMSDSMQRKVRVLAFHAQPWLAMFISRISFLFRTRIQVSHAIYFLQIIFLSCSKYELCCVMSGLSMRMLHAICPYVL